LAAGRCDTQQQRQRDSHGWGPHDSEYGLSALCDHQLLGPGGPGLDSVSCRRLPRLAKAGVWPNMRPRYCLLWGPPWTESASVYLCFGSLLQKNHSRKPVCVTAQSVRCHSMVQSISPNVANHSLPSRATAGKGVRGRKRLGSPGTDDTDFAWVGSRGCVHA